jgi:hypothetical protein
VKYLIKNATYVLISVYAVKLFLDPWSMDAEIRSLSMTAIALMFLYSFLPGILSVVSLPKKGIGLWVLSLVLTYCVLLLMTVLLPFYGFSSSQTPFLNIGSFVLPSLQLSAFQTGLTSALMISIVFNYFTWLSSRK